MPNCKGHIVYDEFVTCKRCGVTVDVRRCEFLRTSSRSLFKPSTTTRLSAVNKRKILFVKHHGGFRYVDDYWKWAGEKAAESVYWRKGDLVAISDHGRSCTRKYTASSR